MWFLDLAWYSCERHFVARDVFTRVCYVHPQVLFRPHYSCALHSLAITESCCSGLSTNNSVQWRSSSSLSVTLNQSQTTSIAWQTLHWSSKIPFPTLASPGGTVTSGYLNPPFFFPPINLTYIYQLLNNPINLYLPGKSNPHDKHHPQELTSQRCTL